MTIATDEKVLIFRAGVCGCALPLDHIIETMRPLPLEPLAGLLPCVKGVCVIRGMATPVLDLGLLLSGREVSPSGRFITIKVARRQAALSVASVIGIAKLTASGLHDLPPLLKNSSADVLDSIGALDAQLFLVLAAGRLIPEEVWSVLSGDGMSP